MSEFKHAGQFDLTPDEAGGPILSRPFNPPEAFSYLSATAVEARLRKFAGLEDEEEPQPASQEETADVSQDLPGPEGMPRVEAFLANRVNAQRPVEELLAMLEQRTGGAPLQVQAGVELPPWAALYMGEGLQKEASAASLLLGAGYTPEAIRKEMLRGAWFFHPKAARSGTEEAVGGAAKWLQHWAGKSRRRQIAGLAPGAEPPERTFLQSAARMAGKGLSAAKGTLGGAAGMGAGGIRRYLRSQAAHVTPGLKVAPPSFLDKFRAALPRWMGFKPSKPKERMLRTPSPAEIEQAQQSAGWFGE